MGCTLSDTTPVAGEVDLKQGDSGKAVSTSLARKGDA
jgi:hypothetical protein